MVSSTEHCGYISSCRPVPNWRPPAFTATCYAIRHPHTLPGGRRCGGGGGARGQQAPVLVRHLRQRAARRVVLRSEQLQWRGRHQAISCAGLSWRGRGRSAVQLALGRANKGGGARKGGRRVSKRGARSTSPPPAGINPSVDAGRTEAMGTQERGSAGRGSGRGARAAARGRRGGRRPAGRGHCRSAKSGSGPCLPARAQRLQTRQVRKPSNRDVRTRTFFTPVNTRHGQITSTRSRPGGRLALAGRHAGVELVDDPLECLPRLGGCDWWPARGRRRSAKAVPAFGSVWAARRRGTRATGAYKTPQRVTRGRPARCQPGGRPAPPLKCRRGCRLSGNFQIS